MVYPIRRRQSNGSVTFSIERMLQIPVKTTRRKNLMLAVPEPTPTQLSHQIAMNTTNPIRIRLSRFVTDRYAYRSQPGYSFELVAFGIIVFTAIWPVILVANAMASAVK